MRTLRIPAERRDKERLLLLLQERARRRDILKWLDGKVNENGVPITFANHEFQEAIWRDFSSAAGCMGWGCQLST